MDPEILQKIIFSILAFLILFIFGQLLKLYAKRTQQKLQIKKSRYFMMKRIISLLSMFLFFILLFFIWGINLKNLWASLTAVLAMIAIAFFAVWSLIGNILAGVIIFFTSPFKINNHIEIMPDEIRGKVLAINAFFTLLTDENDNYISIPNSLFFQRVIKNYKSKNIN